MSGALTNEDLAALHAGGRLPDAALTTCWLCRKRVLVATVVWSAPDSEFSLKDRHEQVLLDPRPAKDMACYVAADGVLHARQRPMLPLHRHDDDGFRRRLFEIGRAEAVRLHRCASCEDAFSPTPVPPGDDGDLASIEASGVCTRCRRYDDAGGRGEPSSRAVQQLGERVVNRLRAIISDEAALTFRQGCDDLPVSVFVSNVAEWEGRRCASKEQAAGSAATEALAIVDEASGVDDSVFDAIAVDGADRRRDEEGAVSPVAGAPDRDAHAGRAR